MGARSIVQVSTVAAHCALGAILGARVARLNTPNALPFRWKLAPFVEGAQPDFDSARRACSNALPLVQKRGIPAHGAAFLVH